MADRNTIKENILVHLAGSELRLIENSPARKIGSDAQMPDPIQVQMYGSLVFEHQTESPSSQGSQYACLVSTTLEIPRARVPAAIRDRMAP